MNQPSSEPRSPAKNMQRHPHTAKASLGKIDDITRKTKDASNAPIPAPPSSTRPDIAPRQFGDAHSVPIVWVDATTPRTNIPKRDAITGTGRERQIRNRSNRSSDQPKTDATMAFLACRLVAGAVVSAVPIFAIVHVIPPLFYLKSSFQRPMNFGGRFALKASTPSLKSSDWRSRL
jgi:hypothetical protein